MIRLAREIPVSLANAQPQLAIGLQLAADALEEIGLDCVITSISEGKHKVGSLHPKGLAADIRTRDWSAAQLQMALETLRSALGYEWDVLYESAKPHIHMEWDPPSAARAVA